MRDDAGFVNELENWEPDAKFSLEPGEFFRDKNDVVGSEFELVSGGTV
jgi:hypothetical protein